MRCTKILFTLFIFVLLLSSISFAETQLSIITQEVYSIKIKAQNETISNLKQKQNEIDDKLSKQTLSNTKKYLTLKKNSMNITKEGGKELLSLTNKAQKELGSLIKDKAELMKLKKETLNEKEKQDIQNKINKVEKNIVKKKEDLKGFWNQIKQIKNNNPSLKEKVKKLDEDLKPIKQQESDLCKTITKSEIKVATQWYKYNKYYRNSELDKASKILTDIITEKESIINNKEKLYEIRVQIGKILKAVEA